jgi:hypothetical protein
MTMLGAGVLNFVIPGMWILPIAGKMMLGTRGLNIVIPAKAGIHRTSKCKTTP